MPYILIFGCVTALVFTKHDFESSLKYAYQNIVRAKVLDDVIFHTTLLLSVLFSWAILLRLQLSIKFQIS